MNNIDIKTERTLLYSLIISAIATVGSLFFSEVMEFTPCKLCWYQRIAMYPIAVIFLLGFWKSDKSALIYSLPLTIIGLLIAIYHNLLTWEIIPETASPCVEGVPCSHVWINYLGFITIPFLSMTAFTLLLGAYFYSKKRN